MGIKSVFAAVAASAVLSGCVETTTGTSMGLNRNVMVVNQSGDTVYRLYGTNTARSDFGPDRLGSQVIPNGSSMVINFDDGSSNCMFDIRVVFPDGFYVDDYGVNVCQISTYVIQ